MLDRLKNDIQTRHIPVCVISTDDARQRSLSSGALAFVAKPIKTREEVDKVVDNLMSYVSRLAKRLLVVEEDEGRRERILSAVADVDVHVADRAGRPNRDGNAARGVIRLRHPRPRAARPHARRAWPDGVRELNSFGPLPILVFGDGHEVADDGSWKRLSEVATVRKVHSAERLLDQATYFLHRNVADLNDERRATLEGLHRSDKVLPGKKVLIVDDDMRNIFALSTVLEEQDMVDRLRRQRPGRDQDPASATATSTSC